MKLLSVFFANRPRPRTVVHAGPLLLRRDEGERSLTHYLRIPRKREVFLVHHGHDSLREVAKETGVPDIAVDAPESEQANAATEMALALGARRLDFTIDEAGLEGPDGNALRAISMREAETLASDPNVRPRIRAKLRAGCAALRKGMARVRIGDPRSLARNRATVLLPNLANPSDARVSEPSGSGSREASGGTPAPRILPGLVYVRPDLQGDPSHRPVAKSSPPMLAA